jgi:hypothetical protein
MAFDVWENAMRAADAGAPDLPYLPEERRPVRDVKPLARSTCRRRRRGTTPRRDADCGSQWRFLRLRACAPPRIVAGVEIWRIDDLLTQNFTGIGVHVRLGVVISGRFRSAFLGFPSFCGVLKKSYRLCVRSIQTKIDELTKRDVPKLR